MKLTIEIPKEVKQVFDNAESNNLKGGFYDYGGIIGRAIQNGIPLDEYKAENRPKGEWDINCQGIVFCSKCKKVFNHNYDIDYMESHFNFCPNCGADTRNKNNC